MNYPNISEMVGKVFTVVRDDGDEIVFENDTEKYTFYHDQDCCERVYVESIVGDLSDLENSPLLLAEEVDGETPVDFDESKHECCEWTFYKFATIKGYVDVRWLGESNGYYSTSVTLKRRSKLN